MLYCILRLPEWSIITYVWKVHSAFILGIRQMMLNNKLREILELIEKLIGNKLAQEFSYLQCI
jgi:hypothetical protein